MMLYHLLFGIANANPSIDFNCTIADQQLWEQHKIEVTEDNTYSQSCAMCLLSAYTCTQECLKTKEEGCLAACAKAFAECTGLTYQEEFWLKEAQPVLSTTEMPAPTKRLGSGALPVVVMHGLSDSGTRMEYLCDNIRQAYGVHANCLNVFNGRSSIYHRMDEQLEAFTKAVREDEKLSKGFNAVGASQGNMLVRAYIERVNDPPVHTYISIVGPHNGVAECPDNKWLRLVCWAWKYAPYHAPFSFSDYWKNAYDKETYLKESRFLADINNEREVKNQTYADNMKKLKNYVLVEALLDVIVKPHVSESHGYLKWGEQSGGKTEDLRETEGYKGDWIGLKTLDTSGRLHQFTYNGSHTGCPHSLWNAELLPFLGPDKLESIVA